MSWETEQWARQQRAGDPVRKAILVAIANEADSSGRNAFPSAKFIAYQCEVSERTVFRRLDELEDMGLIKRVKRFRPDGSQSSNSYDLIGYEPPLQLIQKEPKRRYDRLAGGTANVAPQDDASVTRPPDTAVTPRTPNELPFPPTAEDKSSSVPPPKGGEPPAGDDEPEPEAPRTRRGTRLPDDWTPPPIDTLPQTVQAVVAQWPKGAYEFVATGFAAYWTAESGRRASKRDWRAVWVKWLTGESSRVMAMARGGIKFLSPTMKLADEADIADLERLRVSEDDNVRKLRQFLKDDLGAQTYDGWLRPTAIGIVNGAFGWYVNVICPSRFMADWLKQHFLLALTTMAMRVLQTGEVAIHFEIVSER